MNKFGQSCLLARRMVERGVRLVTINMFETLDLERELPGPQGRPIPLVDYGTKPIMEVF